MDDNKDATELEVQCNEGSPQAKKDDSVNDSDSDSDNESNSEHEGENLHEKKSPCESDHKVVGPSTNVKDVISFRRTKLGNHGINKGLAMLLKSSILCLKAPNVATNLYFSIPPPTSMLSIQTRKDLQDFLIPTSTLETICDISENFALESNLSRLVNVGASRNPISELQLRELVFKATVADLDYYQQKFSNTFGLIGISGPSAPSPIVLQVDDKVLKDNCVMIFVKSFVIDKKDQQLTKSLPYWPSIDGTDEQKSKNLVKVCMIVCMSSSNDNKQTINHLLSQTTLKITFISQLTQYLKTLRMASLPPLPENATRDSNASPVLDALFRPELFSFDMYDKTYTFDQKFEKLMTSDKLGILLVDGGPGTGKTSTVATTIIRYYNDAKKNKRPNPRMLVTAPSNAAADVFYQKLRFDLADLNVCRIGETEKFKYKVKVQSEEDFKKFSEKFEAKANKEDSEQVLSDDVLKKMFIEAANIIVVTLGSSQSPDLVNLRNRIKFDLLVVDECGQANIDEFLYPLYFISITRILPIGDPRQLGATIKSTVLMKYPVENISPFVRMCSVLPSEAIYRFRFQYRMQPFVASMVSKISYPKGDALETDPNGNWTRTQDHPGLLVFSDESWEEKKPVGSFSFENYREAEFAITLLKASLRRQGFNFKNKTFPIGKPLRFKIITLYRGQLYLLNRLLNEHNLHDVVQVQTVDQMQGSECDIAIVSAVRGSSDQNGVGFASDLRRLNVALSRAACVYVLVKHGDFFTQQGWSVLFHEATRFNCVFPKASIFVKDNKIDDLLDICAKDNIWRQVE